MTQHLKYSRRASARRAPRRKENAERTPCAIAAALSQEKAASSQGRTRGDGSPHRPHRPAAAGPQRRAAGTRGAERNRSADRPAPTAPQRRSHPRGAHTKAPALRPAPRTMAFTWSAQTSAVPTQGSGAANGRREKTKGSREPLRPRTKGRGSGPGRPRDPSAGPEGQRAAAPGPARPGPARRLRSGRKWPPPLGAVRAARTRGLCVPDPRHGAAPAPAAPNPAAIPPPSAAPREREMPRPGPPPHLCSAAHRRAPQLAPPAGFSAPRRSAPRPPRAFSATPTPPPPSRRRLEPRPRRRRTPRAHWFPHTSVRRRSLAHWPSARPLRGHGHSNLRTLPSKPRLLASPRPAALIGRSAPSSPLTGRSPRPSRRASPRAAARPAGGAARSRLCSGRCARCRSAGRARASPSGEPGPGGWRPRGEQRRRCGEPSE